MSALGPAVPRNWYLLGPAASLRAGTVASHTIADHDLVVFRGEDGGSPVALAAHCAHMGSHLSGGTVFGERLRCPLHHRLIGGDGCFIGHGSLRQRRYPTREFMGGLFVFLGDPAGRGDLDELGVAGNASCYAGEHAFTLPWQWLVANGLDIEHLSAVHDRKLLRRPTLEQDGARELCVRYLTRPTSSRWSDRIMARLAPDGIHGSIRTIGGSMMLVEAQVGRRETFILMSFVPQAGDETLIRGIVGIKGRPGLSNRISARIARLLFRAFLAKDLGVLADMRWHEPAQVDSVGDEFMRAVAAFFRSLPHA